ncbi:hypothetical protein ACP70R_025388 [Stipagrostis hirtigluma subsp. patula]
MRAGRGWARRTAGSPGGRGRGGPREAGRRWTGVGARSADGCRRRLPQPLPRRLRRVRVEEPRPSGRAHDTLAFLAGAAAAVLVLLAAPSVLGPTPSLPSVLGPRGRAGGAAFLASLLATPVGMLLRAVAERGRDPGARRRPDPG